MKLSEAEWCSWDGHSEGKRGRVVRTSMTNLSAKNSVQLSLGLFLVDSLFNTAAFPRSYASSSPPGFMRISGRIREVELSGRIL